MRTEEHPEPRFPGTVDGEKLRGLKAAFSFVVYDDLPVGTSKTFAGEDGDGCPFFSKETISQAEVEVPACEKDVRDRVHTCAASRTEVSARDALLLIKKHWYGQYIVKPFGVKEEHRRHPFLGMGFSNENISATIANVKTDIRP